MNWQELTSIIQQVEFHGEKFVAKHKGDGFLIHLQYMEPNKGPEGTAVLQQFREWYVSCNATEFEVVQICLDAVIDSMNHRAREHFKYKDVHPFSPNIHIKAHVDASMWKHRPDNHKLSHLPCGCPLSVLSRAEGWKPEYGQPSSIQQAIHDVHLMEAGRTSLEIAYEQQLMQIGRTALQSVTARP